MLFACPQIRRTEKLPQSGPPLFAFAGTQLDPLRVSLMRPLGNAMRSRMPVKRKTPVNTALREPPVNVRRAPAHARPRPAFSHTGAAAIPIFPQLRLGKAEPILSFATPVRTSCNRPPARSSRRIPSALNRRADQNWRRRDSPRPRDPRFRTNSRRTDERSVLPAHCAWRPGYEASTPAQSGLPRYAHN